MSDLKATLKKTLLNSKHSVAELADTLGCAESLLYRYALPGESGAEMPLKRLIPLMLATNDYRLLTHIAARCGFATVKLRRVAELKRRDPETLNAIQSRFSELFAKFLTFAEAASESETLALIEHFDTHIGDMCAMRRSVRDFRQGDLDL